MRAAPLLHLLPVGDVPPVLLLAQHLFQRRIAFCGDLAHGLLVRRTHGFLLLALLTAAPVLTGGQWAVHLLMVLFWVLLGWGQERSLRLADDGPGALLIGGAQMAILVLLIIGKALLFLPVLVLLWLPGWLFLAQRRSPGSLQILWLLSLFVCGAAVAQWSF